MVVDYAKESKQENVMIQLDFEEYDHMSWLLSYVLDESDARMSQPIFTL